MTSFQNTIFKSLALCPVLLLLGCTASSEELLKTMKVDPLGFQERWYKGEAELTSYELKQARYGNHYQGHSVLIYVTEDFLEKEQVKREYGSGKAYPILKLNKTKNFLTGVYPYSLMTSVFSRVDFAANQTAKVSFSSQEWCGTTYTQINQARKGFDVVRNSYFQNENTQQFSLDEAWLEDEIWTRIRIAPNTLPVGKKVKMAPSMEYCQLAHIEPDVFTVKASLKDVKEKRFSKKRIFAYSIEYKKLDRTLTIYFDKEAPYTIYGWRETALSGFGDDAKEMVTEAVRQESIMSDYWNKTRPEDSKLRKKLGLQ